jgi:exonuclease VII small subunit
LCCFQVPIHTSSFDADQGSEELRELRESVSTLTAQCAQLDEANRAWQQYHGTQLDNFRRKLLDCIPINETSTLEQAAQQIVDQVTKEREDSSERHQALEKANEDLLSGS